MGQDERGMTAGCVERETLFESFSRLAFIGVGRRASEVINNAK